MKKILSLLLATAMVISMIPAAFAADGDVTVTYNFTSASNTPLDKVNADATVTNNFINYGTTDTTQWAYLGTNAPKTNYAYTNKLGGFVFSRATYLTVNGNGLNEWVAFKIKVPETKSYTVSSVTTRNYSYSTNALEIYVAPYEGDIAAKFDPTNMGTYGTVSIDADNFGVRKGAAAGDTLLSADYKMARANLRDATLNEKLQKTLTLEKEKEYVLLLNAASEGSKDIATITLAGTEPAVEPEPDPEPDVPPVVEPKSEVFTYGSWNINTTLGSSYVNDASNYATFTVAKSLFGKAKADAENVTEKTEFMWSKPVVGVEVKETGTYDITMSVGTRDIGTEADVYVISKADLEGKYKDDLVGGQIDDGLLKKLPIVGRVSNVSASGTLLQKQPREVGTADFEKGINYIVFRCSSDNIVTTKAGLQAFYLNEITLVESDGTEKKDSAEALTKDVSFAVGADVLVNGEEYTKNSIMSFAPGKEVRVKVKNAENFSGWVRGTNKNGVTISFDEEYIFTIASNTYLTPVYADTPLEETQMVEFWNENGSYIGKASVTDGKALAPEATLAGYEFDAWYIDAEKTLTLDSGYVDVSEYEDVEVIHAVAKYNGIQSMGNHKSIFGAGNDVTAVANGWDRVNVNGTPKFDGGTTSPPVFGTEIICQDNLADHWLRDGLVVAYGPMYKYYVWDGTNIYSSHYKTEHKPIVALEKRTVDGAYMIEYDKGDADKVVEAGIIFGSSDKINLASTDGSKAVSQRNEAHGQFCASPNADAASDYARGYLIYEKNGTNYVVYTAAMATSAE